VTSFKPVTKKEMPHAVKFLWIIRCGIAIAREKLTIANDNDSHMQVKINYFLTSANRQQSVIGIRWLNSFASKGISMNIQAKLRKAVKYGIVWEG